MTANYAVTQLTNATLDAREDRLIDLSEIIVHSQLNLLSTSTTEILPPSKINAMVIKAMTRNIGPLANVVILLLGVIYTVKIVVQGTFIPRLSHYPQAAELIAHLRRFATHTLAVSIASYPLHVTCGFLVPTPSVEHSEVSQLCGGKALRSIAASCACSGCVSSSKFMALFKVMIGAKIEPYYINILVNLLPVNVSSQLMLCSCYHQSLTPVRGSLWKILPAIPYMLAQSPMPADVYPHPLIYVPVIDKLHIQDHSNIRIRRSYTTYVSAYRSYSLADDLMSSPLVPILMIRNPIAVRLSGAQQGAPESINEDKDDFFNEEMIRQMSASSNAKPTAAATEADATPSATTHSAADPTPSATTATAADPTVDSINTFGGVQQVAPENINQDKDNFFNEETTRRMSLPSALEEALMGDLLRSAKCIDTVHCGVGCSSRGSGWCRVCCAVGGGWSGICFSGSGSGYNLTASGGEGSEASMWALGNQAVEFDTQEEINDLWSAFHSMKKQTKGGLAAATKPLASINMAASGAAWVQWGICARDYSQFPTGWPCNQVGQFRHPPLANIGVEAYRADSGLDGAPAESIQMIPASYLGAYQLVRVNLANGDPASM
ncbi:hypothetical protein BU17DRAFT_61149 [Hysterangium stoloniferum]|nr:hypothetical protein BU17DRAFT_61149 [Hysterangium stoloniferum]